MLRLQAGFIQFTGRMCFGREKKKDNLKVQGFREREGGERESEGEGGGGAVRETPTKTIQSYIYK